MKHLDDCICPECEECGSIGDPLCYREHGLRLSEEQVASAEEYKQAHDVDPDEDEICTKCAGTGIGQHGDPATSRCTACGGSGVRKKEDNGKDWDFIRKSRIEDNL